MELTRTNNRCAP